MESKWLSTWPQFLEQKKIKLTVRFISKLEHRHGDKCSRLHNKSTFSQTILLQNMYQNPQNQASVQEGPVPQKSSLMSDVEAQEHYDTFFEDVFLELEEKYEGIEEMNVCDNLGDHLVGNVCVEFRFEEDTEKAVNDVNNRWYNGAPIYAELSPVTDFRESCCRQYEMGECTRGGFCNFMHLKPISRELRRRLYGRRRGGAGVRGGASSGPLVRRGRSRSFSPASPRRRSRSRSPRHRRRRSRSRSH